MPKVGWAGRAHISSSLEWKESPVHHAAPDPEDALGGYLSSPFPRGRQILRPGVAEPLAL